jgi:hypothetical protein
VDPWKLGPHELTYTVSDVAGNASAAVARTVTVEDTTPPQLSLSGPAEVYIGVGESFEDPGAAAYDAFEGDLSAAVERTGLVDPDVPGTYVLRYDVEDPSGNAAPPVERIVVVSDALPAGQAWALVLAALGIVAMGMGTLLRRGVT